MSRINSRQERRKASPVGLWHRAQFDASLKTLRTLGLSAHAIEYCKRLARETQRLPHELLVEIVEEALLHTSGV